MLPMNLQAMVAEVLPRGRAVPRSEPEPSSAPVTGSGEVPGARFPPAGALEERRRPVHLDHGTPREGKRGALGRTVDQDAPLAEQLANHSGGRLQGAPEEVVGGETVERSLDDEGLSVLHVDPF